MEKEDFVTVPMPDKPRVAVICCTCGNDIPLRGRNTFPICQECLEILKAVIAERKNSSVSDK